MSQSLDFPRWIAHRGGGTLAPENTLAGMRLAARMGFRAVEFDVMLSADGSPYLLHDETLERTTNGRGWMSETPDAVLAQLDAGDGEPLPTFKQALALCAELGLAANVEIKPASGFELPTAAAVVAELQRWQAAGLPAILLSSFSLPALRYVQATAPDLPRAVLFESLPEDWLTVAQSLGAEGVHCDADAVTQKQVQAAVDRNITLRCYTVNDPEQAKTLLAWGVSGLFTDRLDIFAQQASSVAR